MKVWLREGPFDGIEIEIPELIEHIIFGTSSDKAIVYQHLGPKDDPDQSGPEAGNNLYWQPGGRLIAATVPPSLPASGA